MARYPNVECDRHPGQAKPGYAVCEHRDRKLREMASPASLGVLICDICDAFFEERAGIGALTTACADCVSDEVSVKGEA